MRKRVRRYGRVGLALLLVLAQASSLAQSTQPASAPPAPAKQLAPGFTHLKADDVVLLMPIDVELYSVSAGGVAEPRADWTTKAHANLLQAIDERRKAARVGVVELNAEQADEFAELSGLHAAVAQAIALHHFGNEMWALPTKEGRLDWSFREAMKPLRAASGARYALFVWVRDSYASPERIAMAVVIGLVSGVAIGGGVQTGYASLVDLESGQVVWFNRLSRPAGDLRELKPARESVNALLQGFPGVP